MPGADDKKTKYVTGGSLANGTYFDIIQWKSGKGAKADGYVADKRVMEGGKALVSAEGKKDGDAWTVTFTRKLASGGEGDIAMAAGKTYNMGFAIHANHAAGRFHHVSLGYTLGIDAKADITGGEIAVSAGGGLRPLDEGASEGRELPECTIHCMTASAGRSAICDCR